LGSDHTSLTRTISSWNKFANLKDMLLIADDNIGGFFALNGGFLPFDIGRIFYLEPDVLERESLEILYSNFLHWAITGDLTQFYEPFLWNGWAEDILSSNGDKGFSFYPFPRSEESLEILIIVQKILSLLKKLNRNH
jgi:hypothetical protein